MFEQKLLIDLLENTLGKPEDGSAEQRSGGQACVFSLSFAEDGRPLPESFVLSMAAWAFGDCCNSFLKLARTQYINLAIGMHEHD